MPERTLTSSTCFCSFNPSDADPAAVAELLQLASACSTHLGSTRFSDSSLVRRNFSYWAQGPHDAAHLRRLQTAWAHSLCSVVTFADIGDCEWLSREEPPRPAWQRQVLVGCVRASGDASLVATVHDLAVHPALQGRGLGSRMLGLLTQQLGRLGIYDVGMAAPAWLMKPGANGAMHFEADLEGSTFMMLGPNGGGRGKLSQQLVDLKRRRGSAARLRDAANGTTLPGSTR